MTSFDTSLLASFAMMIHVLGPGGEDRNALHDLVEERVAPRFASVSGVSQAMTSGGAGRQVTVAVDPDRIAALGVTTEAVTESVNRNVGHLRFLGKLESGAGRMPVVLDGRPPGLHSLGEVRVDPERPVLLRHVSELRYGSGREEARFRVGAGTGSPRWAWSSSRRKGPTWSGSDGGSVRGWPSCRTSCGRWAWTW